MGWFHIGKTEIDSTTGLILDEYPDDPDRYEKESSNPSIILLVLIIVIPLILVLMLLVGIVIFAVIRSRSKEEAEDENNPIIGCADYDNDPDIDLIL